MRNEKAALTVDVEDGINIGMRDLMGREMPPTERVVKNTMNILELFEQHEAKATFFVLGQVAEHYPELVKSIHKAGHEIGVHGYDHYQFFRMDYEMAKDQLKRARSLLQDLTGQEVLGHRAPAFSINEENKWALELLAELGFTYDSSIMPCKGFNYGWSSFQKDITHIKFENEKLLYEFPMSVINVLGKEIPTLGGSYLRLLPSWASKYSFDTVLSKQRTPVVFIHPYELDEVRYPDYFFEALKEQSLKTKARVLFMRLNRKRVADKLSGLLSEYQFDTMSNILQEKKRRDAAIEIKTITLESLKRKKY